MVVFRLQPSLLNLSIYRYAAINHNYSSQKVPAYLKTDRNCFFIVPLLRGIFCQNQMYLLLFRQLFD